MQLLMADIKRSVRVAGSYVMSKLESISEPDQSRR